MQNLLEDRNRGLVGLTPCYFGLFFYFDTNRNNSYVCGIKYVSNLQLFTISYMQIPE